MIVNGQIAREERKRDSTSTSTVSVSFFTRHVYSYLLSLASRLRFTVLVCSHIQAVSPSSLSFSLDAPPLTSAFLWSLCSSQLTPNPPGVDQSSLKLIKVSFSSSTTAMRRRRRRTTPTEAHHLSSFPLSPKLTTPQQPRPRSSTRWKIP